MTIRGLVEAATTSGVIFIMLFAVIMLSRIFIMENVPNLFMGMLDSVSDNKNVCLILINVFILIVGMLMDDGSAILLLTPIMMPLFRGLGLTMVQSAAILAVNTGMGTVTPPCAPFLFFAARVGNADVGEMLKPTFIYLIFCWLPTLIMVTYFPDVSTWLPRIMGLTIS